MNRKKYLDLPAFEVFDFLEKYCLTKKNSFGIYFNFKCYDIFYKYTNFERLLFMVFSKFIFLYVIILLMVTGYKNCIYCNVIKQIQDSQYTRIASWWLLVRSGWVLILPLLLGTNWR